MHKNTAVIRIYLVAVYAQVFTQYVTLNRSNTFRDTNVFRLLRRLVSYLSYSFEG